MSKKHYLCVMRKAQSSTTVSTTSKETPTPPSPAQMEAMYAKFNAWKETFKDNIVDLGGKLGDGKVVTTEGVTDGPFVEVKELIGGFMILSANSIDEAIEVAQQSPGVFMGSSVEVREIITP